MIDDIADNEPEYSDKEITVIVKPKDNRVFGSTHSTKVVGIVTGFDWDDWQIMLKTEKPICLLSDN